MGLSQADREEPALTRMGSLGECKRPARAQRTDSQEKIRSASAKPRRPDRAVYVPRALRTAESAATEEKITAEDKNPAEDTPTHTRKRSRTPNTKSPKSPRDKSNPETQRKTDKNFCNVYTPPHLRNQRSHTAPSTDDEATITSELVPSVEHSDSALEYSDTSGTFYIGDYFAKGQLGLYDPNLYYRDFTDTSERRFSGCQDREDYTVYPKDHWSNANDINMAVPESRRNLIDSGYGYSKDDDPEKDELIRASQEINRSNKRIIKQSFHSDVLVISDPIDDNVDEQPKTDVAVKEKVTSPIKEKPKLEAKASLKREENDWDAVFDDSGECLDPSLLEELTATVGKVYISKAKNNYEQYQTKGQSLFNGPYDESLAHVVEVYDFPSEFKTNDLLSVFSEYKDTGFEIKWVNDTHALIVFSSAKIAAEVLSANRPLVKCRPLHAATPESRNKAKKCAEFLQPYRQRPETCTALARRLVSGALGVRLSTAGQERAEERRLITLAREKKRQAALHKEAAWEGSLGDDHDNLATS